MPGNARTGVVTVKESEQLPLAATPALLSVSLFVVSVVVPPQLVLPCVKSDAANPTGKFKVSPAPEIAEVVALLKLIVATTLLPGVGVAVLRLNVAVALPGGVCLLMDGTAFDALVAPLFAPLPPQADMSSVQHIPKPSSTADLM